MNKNRVSAVASMRRKGGVPPMVTVLVTIASIVAASLVAWFLFTTTRGAVSQPVFEVLSAYAIGTGTSRSLSITVKYLSGPSGAAISSPSLTLTAPSGASSCSSFSNIAANPSTVSPGQSFTVTATCTLATGITSLDGHSGTLQFSLGSSTVLVGFKVVEP